MHKQSFEIKEFPSGVSPGKEFYIVSKAEAAVLEKLSLPERKAWLAADLKRKRNATKRARKARRANRR